MLPEASDFRPGQGGRLTTTGPWRNGAEVTECQALWLSISGERPTAAQKGGLHTVPGRSRVWGGGDSLCVDRDDLCCVLWVATWLGLTWGQLRPEH